jgi:excisionase family DNA binding protein
LNPRNGCDEAASEHSKRPTVDILTTRQVADMLAVSEATVKRWADAGTLLCFRTPGGHRKFRAADIADFRRRHQYDIEKAAGEGVDGSDYVAQFRSMALSGDSDRLVTLIAQLRMKGLSLAAVFDTVAGPALIDIGERWARGAVTVAQEHLAAQTVVEALSRVRALIEVPATKGRVLLAAPGEEQHDIALRMMAVLLVGMGYSAMMLGARCPVPDLALMITADKPSAVVLSFAVTHPFESVRESVNQVAIATRSVGAKLFVGGEGTSKLDVLPANSFKTHSLVEFVETLVTNA